MAEKTEFMKRFELLCKEHGYSIRGACEAMGLSGSTPTNWKKKGMLPNAKTQGLIADFFGISVDELMRPLGEAKNAVISNEYVDFVSAFAKLNESDKAFVLRLIDFLLKDKKDGQEIC